MVVLLRGGTRTLTLHIGNNILMVSGIFVVVFVLLFLAITVGFYCCIVLVKCCTKTVKKKTHCIEAFWANKIFDCYDLLLVCGGGRRHGGGCDNMFLLSLAIKLTSSQLVVKGCDTVESHGAHGSKSCFIFLD